MIFAFIESSLDMGAAMQPADLSAVRRDLAEWSEPLIADCIGEYYSLRFSGDVRRVRPLTQLHCRLWREVLLQDSSHARITRRELVRLGRLAGVDPPTLNKIDEIVVDELVDVIAARFHRSPSTTGSYAKSLIRVAESLTEARIAS